MKLVFLAAFFLTIILGCQQPTPINVDAQKKIIDEVTQTLHNYYADIKKTGLLAEFKYLDSSENFFWVPPGYTTAISYDSVAKILKSNALGLRSIENSWESLRIIPLSNEVVSYSGRLNSIVTDQPGKTSRMKLIETGVLIKRNKEWKLLNGQTSIISQ